MIGGKEIYPNPERVERRTELVVVHLKTRLLGGVKLKQVETKTINLEEKKLNSGLNNGLVMLRDSSQHEVPIDNWDLIEQEA